MKVKSLSGVQFFASDPMDFSLPGPSIHGIFQARVLEWGAIAFSRESFLVGKKKVSSVPCLETTGKGKLQVG